MASLSLSLSLSELSNFQFLYLMQSRSKFMQKRSQMPHSIRPLMYTAMDLIFWRRKKTRCAFFCTCTWVEVFHLLWNSIDFIRSDFVWAVEKSLANVFQNCYAKFFHLSWHKWKLSVVSHLTQITRKLFILIQFINHLLVCIIDLCSDYFVSRTLHVARARNKNRCKTSLICVDV